MNRFTYWTDCLHCVADSVCLFLHNHYIQSIGDRKQYEAQVALYRESVRESQPAITLSKISNHIIFIGAIGLTISRSSQFSLMEYLERV